MDGQSTEYHNLQPVGQSHKFTVFRRPAGANLESQERPLRLTPMSIDFTNPGTARGLNLPAYDSLFAGHPILISIIWAPLSAR